MTPEEQAARDRLVDREIRESRKARRKSERSLAMVRSYIAAGDGLRRA